MIRFRVCISQIIDFIPCTLKVEPTVAVLFGSGFWASLLLHAFILLLSRNLRTYSMY